MQAFLRRIAARLSAKWQKPLSTVSNWVRVRVQFELIKAVDLRTRGSTRKRWRSSGFEDGEGIDVVFQRQWGVLYSCLNSMLCIDLGFGI